MPDDLDVAILQALRRDARLSMRALARELGSTTPTVAARVRALEADGHLLGYHARVPDASLGGRSAWLLVQCPPAGAEHLASELAAQAWADEVHALAGGRVLARARLGASADLADVQRWLAQRPEALAYDVHEALSSQRTGPSALGEARLRARCHQCGRAIEAEPLRATLGGRRHTFCCTVCRDTFQARFRRAAEGTAAAPGRLPMAP